MCAPSYVVIPNQICSKYSPGTKLAPTKCHMFYMGLYKKHEEILSSETKWPRVLIFSEYHHLVDVYKVCSNYFTVAEYGPVLRPHILGQKRNAAYKD